MTMVRNRTEDCSAWLIAGTGLLLSCLGWTLLSYQFEFGQGHADRPIIGFLGLFLLAWVSFLAFFVVFVASIGYLWKRERKYDMAANSAAEIGVLFYTLVLVTGPILARPVWNTSWDWTPRLTLFRVLWFIFIAYLMLRNFVEGEEKSARFCAVFGIVGFVDVPIVYMSIRLWRDIRLRRAASTKR